MTGETLQPLVALESPAGHLRSAVVPVLMFIVVLAVTVTDDPIDRWPSVPVLGISLLVLGPRLWSAFRARAGDWVVRVDAEGVTWRTGRHVPWAEIAEVRTERLLSGIGALSRLRVGAERVTLVSPMQADLAKRAQAQPKGTVIVTSTLSVTAAQFAEAVSRFSSARILRY